MKSSTPLPVFILQLIIGTLFLFVGITKFLQADMSLYIFSTLGMEPEGRYIIGSVEILSGLLLLTRMAAMGAFIGLGTMLGAIIAHVTVLGLVVQNDGGSLVLTLVFLFFSCCIVLWHRRKELPILGASF